MPRIRRLVCTAACLASPCLAGPASALAVYAYAGSGFTNVIEETPPVGSYTEAMNVDGHSTVAASLAAKLGYDDISASVTSCSFGDGRDTLTDAKPTIVFSDVARDKTSDWLVALLIDSPSLPAVGAQQLGLGTGSGVIGTAQDRGAILECLDADTCSGSSGSDLGFANLAPGAWMLVPEPSSAALLSAGLLGLARGAGATRARARRSPRQEAGCAK